MKKDTKILALTGKGGVGKTTVCAAFVRALTEKHKGAKILAIDADPAVGLATALGVEVKETLDNIRTEVIEKAEDGKGREAIELLGEVRYRIFDAIVETDSFSFLAIGRPEGAGCYCSINSYLKDVIAMVSEEFDYVVIDGEAGIEQVNRRVMDKVTHLFLVTDMSKKGIQVIKTIKKVADDLVGYEKLGVIVNRLDDPAMLDIIMDEATENSENELSQNTDEDEGKNHCLGTIDGMDIVAAITRDPAHAKNDMLGRTVFELDETSPVYVGALQALDSMSL